MSAKNKEEIKEYIKEHALYMTQIEIANIFNINSKLILTLMKEMKLNRMELIKQFVFDNYKNMTIKEIASTCKCSICTISKIKRENNLAQTIQPKLVSIEIAQGEESIPKSNKKKSKRNHYSPPIIKRFSKDELQELHDYIELNYKNETDIEIAKKFSCSSSKIEKYRLKHNLLRSKKAKPKIFITDNDLYDGEIFKSLESLGFSNYEISNYGRARHKSDYKQLYLNTNKDGYNTFTMINDFGATKHVLVHRLVAIFFVFNDDKNKTDIDHIDCNKTNNIYTNLEWVTRQENINRAKKNGLLPLQNGENNNNVKYTNDLVIKVCELLQEGKTPYEIHQIYPQCLKGWIYKLKKKEVRFDIAKNYIF